MNTLKMNQISLATTIINDFFGQTISMPESLVPILNPIFTKAYTTAIKDLQSTINNTTTPEMLLEYICYKLDKEKKDLLTNRREETSFTKHLFFYVSKQVLPKARHKDLAKELNLNHSMVIYGIRKIETLLATKDKKYSKTILMILNDLNIPHTQNLKTKNDPLVLIYHNENSSNTQLQTPKHNIVKA